VSTAFAQITYRESRRDKAKKGLNKDLSAGRIPARKALISDPP